MGLSDAIDQEDVDNMARRQQRRDERRNKVYIAASYKQKEKARELRSHLQDEGFVVTSHWLDEPDPPDTVLDDDRAEKWEACARRDLVDIQASDALVLMQVNGDLSTRGGRHFETGYAFALGKRVVVVGDRGSVFHYLYPEVTWVPRNELGECLRSDRSA